MAESRTTKSIKNAQVALFFYLAQMILGFWSRKIFYDYLGSEVLGLDTTAATMLGFLNLAELGVSASIGYFLYKPMYDGQYEDVNEIVSLQGWLYKKVAFVIIVLAVILMCFFPIIFSDIKIPLWYTYATFSILLFGALLGYFVNYKMCVLYADQKGYKTTKVTLTANMALKIILILSLPHVAFPFLFYLGTNLIGVILGTVWLNYVLKKEYPWLGKSTLSGKELLKKYPDVLKKTKQIFVHRISTVIILEIQPMIMYGFSTLTAVAYYGNYIATIGKAKDIIKTAFGSTQAGIGNLIASRDNKHIMEVFWELFDSRLCLATSSLLVLAFVTDPFISRWLSPNYLLGNGVLILVTIQCWISINRTTIDNYIAGYGMFQDTWAPIVEMILYLTGAFVFGSMMGLSGVLAGALLSNIIIICLWKPYFLFARGFNLNPIRHFFLPVVKRLLLIGANIVIFCWINIGLKSHFVFSTYIDIFLYGLTLALLIIPVLYGEFLLFSVGTRQFNKRIIGLVANKFIRKKI